MSRISRATVLGLAMAMSSWAAPAHAYLVDANDARVVAPGTLELELQPAGYFQILVGDEEYYLLAPSAQIYAGLAERWDMLLLTRGYVGLGPTTRQSPYALAEQFLAFRALLVDGSYSSEGERDGPSLALQMGVFLPGVEAETGFGSSLALLFAWQADVGTFHANAWTNFTQDGTFNFFASVVLEGPPAWSVRPVVEIWADVDDGETTLSGLLGVIGDVSDEFALQAGVRVGGSDGYLDLEVRLSSWIYWEPTPAEASAEEDEEEHDGNGAPQRGLLVTFPSPRGGASDGEDPDPRERADPGLRARLSRAR